MYKGFADVYDVLMQDVDYEKWAGYYMDLAAHMGVVVRTAVDCACGTGGITLPMAARGVRMTGVDVSQEMLSVAAERARHRGIAVPFVHQDMKRLRLHRSVDAVFSACDGVNYLVRPDDARAFFAAAYAQLRPGGGLFFDVSTRYKLSRVLGNKCLGADAEQAAYIWQNHYDEAEGILQMDLTLFAKEPDGRYRKMTETHRQRAYDKAWLFESLAEAGFSNICAFGDCDFEEPGERAQRMHIAAIRFA